MTALRAFVLLSALVLTVGSAHGQEFRLEEVASVPDLPLAQMKPKTIAFSDRQSEELAEPISGFIRFEDWARSKPVQQKFLSLFPSYSEPSLEVTVNGVKRRVADKLHVYVAEARVVLDRAAGSFDLPRFATIKFLDRVDPAIKHRPISPSEIAPLNGSKAGNNRNPQRPWCENRPVAMCIQSRYDFEGKLPIGIRLANKLRESGKQIADHIDFQSELTLLSPAELADAELTRLTGVDAAITGGIEQSIFYVNQVMQFGKLLAILQPHPSDPKKTVASLFIALGVESSLLGKRKEYGKIPVLRNLVPAQVLAGKSSFNTGSSISAGLPVYARNRIKAIAAILDRE